ncbi:MAG TPA: VOC family protein [Acidimicrobiales bacterium]|jgi:catechol 2,3-dioxygenase-like lactoylglutathione lyase family enzyme|nr:VOC family protein [Acidimicrobiales bacterium]
MRVIHHVNINVPRGRGESVAAFYCEALDMSLIPRPDNGREGVWLDMGDGTQLHLSERDDVPNIQPHFALIVDDLAVVRASLAKVGADFEPADDVFGTGGRGFTRDPAGNRIELIAR